MSQVSNQLKTQHTLAADANDTATVTTSIDLELCREVFFTVEADTGTSTTHVVTLQMSADNSNWHDHASAAVTGLGFASGTVGARWCRLKVTTAQGAASTVNLRVNARA